MSVTEYIIICDIKYEYEYKTYILFGIQIYNSMVNLLHEL